MLDPLGLPESPAENTRPSEDKGDIPKSPFHSIGEDFERMVNCTQGWFYLFAGVAAIMAALPIGVVCLLAALSKGDVPALAMPAVILWLFTMVPLFWLALYARRRAVMVEALREDYRFKAMCARALAKSGIKLDAAAIPSSFLEKVLVVVAQPPVRLLDRPLLRQENQREECKVTPPGQAKGSIDASDGQ